MPVSDSFEGDGIVTTGISGFDQGTSVTVQADGKILVLQRGDAALVPLGLTVKCNFQAQPTDRPASPVP